MNRYYLGVKPNKSTKSKNKGAVRTGSTIKDGYVIDALNDQEAYERLCALFRPDDKRPISGSEYIPFGKSVG